MATVQRPSTPSSRPSRSYPHVDNITDWSAKASLRLLWDRCVSLAEDLEAALSRVSTLEASLTSLTEAHAVTAQTANTAMAAAGKLTSTSAFPSGEGNIGGGFPPGGAVGDTPTTPQGIDDGLASQGIADAKNAPNGHMTGALTAILVGQIIQGTANEFSALVAPAASTADRDANALELLQRMIWHLNLAGFTAGRQRNPSGVISQDKLTVRVDGVFRAYDVFASNVYTQPIPIQAIQVFPADYVADAGIAD